MQHPVTQHPVTETPYRRLLRYSQVHWRVGLVALVGIIGLAAADNLLIVTIKYIIDDLMLKRDSTVIVALPFVIVGLFLMRGTFEFIGNYSMTWIARNIVTTLRQQLFQHYLDLPVGFFDQNATGQLVSRLKTCCW